MCNQKNLRSQNESEGFHYAVQIAFALARR